MKEQVVLLGPSRRMVGIVTEPAQGDRTDRPAAILLSAGLIHRVGPNRLYVKLARRLAAQGTPVLRFDLSGVGDSQPRSDHLPYLSSSVLEAREAMNWLQSTRNINRFLLIGHCAGAINSFRTARQDPRVAGLAMINIEAGDERWTRYDRERKMGRFFASYYRHSLADRDKWIRLLTGRAHYRKIASAIWNGVVGHRLSALIFRLRRKPPSADPAPETPPEVASAPHDLRALAERGARPLFVFPENSTGHEYVRNLFGATFDELHRAGKIQVRMISQADHLYTLQASQEQLAQTIETWAQNAS